MADDAIVITIDNDLADLIPGYLANRRNDIDKMNSAIDAADFETVRVIGHQLKGSGGGYGFDFITDAGAAVEQAAKNKDVNSIRRHIAALGDYLNRLEIVYE
ncbi:MAG: Hpt domain-containing protein [Candidatus Magnetominusculus sp. LBB02]|nr:Hpt domain-containing protein [Candidatus Magnetominusculus sp. LBB02]